MSASARFAVLALAALALGATSAHAPDAAALLHGAIAAPTRVSYVGEVQSIEIGQSQSAVSVFRMEHKAPDFSRRWYLAPQSLFGDSIITHGETTYNVDVKHNRIVVDENDAIDDQVALDDNFGLLMENYRAVLAPDETIAGRAARVVLLVNRHTGQTTMRVWIDEKTDLVLQKERYAGNGSLASQTRFQQIRYTGNIPAGVFAVPSGFTKVRGVDHGVPSNDVQSEVRAAGFAARGPRYLPDGFVPVTGDVSNVKGVRTLHLLYSDGIRTISLFQNARDAAVDMSRFHPHDVSVQGHQGRYVEDGPVTLLAWSEAGLHFALVGELSRTELVKIAASIVP